VSINPFASYNIDTRRTRHKTPGVIGNESIILSLHNRSPIGVWQCITNRTRKRRHGHNMEVEAIHGLCDASLATCTHQVCIGDRRDDDRSCSSCAAGIAGNNLCTSSRAAGPITLVVGVVPLAATCAGCTGAAAPDDANGGVEVAPWAAELDPCNHGPAPRLDNTGVASGTRCVAVEAAVPARTKRAPGTEAVRS
jgi:hypothetical protein